MFRRTQVQSKELKKEYKSNPSKFILFLFVCFAVFIYLAYRTLDVLDSLSKVDDSKIIVLLILALSAVLIIVPSFCALIVNLKKKVILTPVFFEFISGKTHIRAEWKDFPFYIAQELFYKCVLFKDDKKDDGKYIYIDSLFFDKYNEMEKIINTAKKSAMKKDVIHI